MSNDTRSDIVFNTQVAAMWLTRNGNLLTMKVDDRMKDFLGPVFEKIMSDASGGKFIVKQLSEEARAKHRGGTEKAPTHYLEYITAAEVAKYEAKNAARRDIGSNHDRF